MSSKSQDQEIRELGKEFFAAISGEAPSIFNKDWWTGRVMDWSMSHEDFKLQLFRFIDVLPYLKTEAMLGGHIREYFSEGENVPTLLKLGAKSAGIGGRLGMKVLGATVRKNLEKAGLFRFDEKGEFAYFNSSDDQKEIYDSIGEQFRRHWQ